MHLLSVAQIVKSLTRDTNEELAKAFGRARTSFSVTMDDLAESAHPLLSIPIANYIAGVTSQAMNFCKNNANADRYCQLLALLSRSLLVPSGPRHSRRSGHTCRALPLM